MKDADNSLDDHWDAQDSIFVFTNSEGQPFSVDAEIATLLTMFRRKNVRHKLRRTKYKLRRHPTLHYLLPSASGGIPGKGSEGSLRSNECILFVV